MEGLHVRARADQSIIRSALHSERYFGRCRRAYLPSFFFLPCSSRSDRLGPMTIRDLDDVNTLLRLSRNFEREKVAPYRARVYPDLAWSTAVPCLPVDREEQLPDTAPDMLGHDTFMSHLFRKPEPDSSQHAVEAARDYLEAVVKPSVQPAAAPPSLAANRQLLHAEIRPFGQIWLTTLQRFAPGPEESVRLTRLVVRKEAWKLKRDFLQSFLRQNRRTRPSEHMAIGGTVYGYRSKSCNRSSELGRSGKLSLSLSLDRFIFLFRGTNKHFVRRRLVTGSWLSISTRRTTMSLKRTTSRRATRVL